MAAEKVETKVPGWLTLAYFYKDTEKEAYFHRVKELYGEISFDESDRTWRVIRENAKRIFGE